jgi:hypothetical protein
MTETEYNKFLITITNLEIFTKKKLFLISTNVMPFINILNISLIESSQYSI